MRTGLVDVPQPDGTVCTARFIEELELPGYPEEFDPMKGIEVLKDYQGRLDAAYESIYGRRRQRVENGHHPTKAVCYLEVGFEVGSWGNWECVPFPGWPGEHDQIVEATIMLDLKDAMDYAQKVASCIAENPDLMKWTAEDNPRVIIREKLLDGTEGFNTHSVYFFPETASPDNPMWGGGSWQ